MTAKRLDDKLVVRLIEDYDMKVILHLAPWIAVCGFIATAAAGEVPKVETIVSQQQEIRAEVKARSGRYKEMPATTRDELLARQDELLRVLDGKQSLDELPENQRLKVFNTLEWIEATVNNLEAERMVCTREKTIGSNRIERVCRTVAQMKKEREQAQQDLLRNSAGGMKSGN
jgi:hypothetical protein